MLGNRSRDTPGSAGTNGRTHPGQTGHLPPIGKTMPIQDFSPQYFAGQQPKAFGLTLGLVFNLLADLLKQTVHAQNQYAQIL